ncbi:MAG: FeoB-associated Cys-rich membrane protein [Lachnospiraceae bacterium]|nr:FeoB-associated Cys-rich membrane protein [Lachnospiraceae bacterium]MCI9545553.1 FeoB-associated Cys-rich membrane protein [Lachnospiraceae bacterium]
MIVVFVIVLCLAAVLWYHVSRRRKGETGCGCGCSGCSVPPGCGCQESAKQKIEKQS